MIKKLSAEEILEFLKIVDKTFPVPLSEKQDLSAYAKKLAENATLCVEEDENGRIISMLAGYTENLPADMAYLTMGATLKDYQGKGLLTKLFMEFLELCEEKQLSAAHMYAVEENVGAVRLYRKLGFVDWKIENDPRPNDLHMIYYFKDNKH